MDIHSLGWGVAFGLAVTVGALSWQITDLRRRLDCATGATRSDRRDPLPPFDPVRLSPTPSRRAGGAE